MEAPSKLQVESNFAQLQAALKHLWLSGAVQKDSPRPAMIWLGFEFDKVDMTVTILQEKLMDIMALIW